MRISTQTPTWAITVSQQIAAATPAETKDTYGPRGPEFKNLRDPFKEGLRAAALVGLPALLGAAETAVFGTAAGTFASIPLNAPIGAVVGAAFMGYEGYKDGGGEQGAAQLGFLGAIGGSICGAILPLTGVWGGLTGAGVATGVAGVGVAIWALNSNHKVHQEVASPPSPAPPTRQFVQGFPQT